jgi:uroporphyrin-III C-methyltransferase
MARSLGAAGVACEVVPGVTAAIAAAADTQRPLTRRGSGRSVSLSTAMTRSGSLHAKPQAGPRADTEVFYMAGRQLAALARSLGAAGWPLDTPVCVVSRAGWPDRLCSDHRLAELGAAALLHAGRPTVVTVGAGARAVAPAALPSGTTAASAAAPAERALSAS